MSVVEAMEEIRHMPVQLILGEEDGGALLRYAHLLYNQATVKKDEEAGKRLVEIRDSLRKGLFKKLGSGGEQKTI